MANSLRFSEKDIRYLLEATSRNDSYLGQLTQMVRDIGVDFRFYLRLQETGLLHPSEEYAELKRHVNFHREEFTRISTEWIEERFRSQHRFRSHHAYQYQALLGGFAQTKK